MYIIAIQIAILIAHSVLFQFSVVNSSRVWHHPPQHSTNAATVMLGHVQVVLASVCHESGVHTAEHLEDCRHYKKHRSTSVSVVGCHFPGLWVSKS